MQDPGSVFLFCEPGSRATDDFPATTVFSATVDPVPAPHAGSLVGPVPVSCRSLLIRWMILRLSRERFRTMCCGPGCAVVCRE